MVKKIRLTIVNRKKIRLRISEQYFRENWGVPFIMGFILLLGVALASSLLPSTQSGAESLAICACYSLFVGVILQIASFLKYDPKNKA